MSNATSRRLIDRFRTTSKQVAAISDELARADQKLDQVDGGLEFLFSKLMAIKVEEAGPLQTDFDTLRDQLAAALITQSTVRDKMLGLFTKLEALIGHGFETSELYVEARRLISQTLADLVKFRGDFNNTATVIMGLMDDEVFQQFIASDQIASERMLELIGKDRVATWLEESL